jgi:hypothetical protein
LPLFGFFQRFGKSGLDGAWTIRQKSLYTDHSSPTDYIMPGFFRTLSRDLRAPFHRKRAFDLLHQLHSEKLPLEGVVERAIKLGTNGWYRVRSLQVLSEITGLAREVAALKPKVILEIGTARGGTALIWAHLAEKKLVTCDLLDKKGFADLVRAFPAARVAMRGFGGDRRFA